MPLLTSLLLHLLYIFTENNLRIHCYLSIIFLFPIFYLICFAFFLDRFCTFTYINIFIIKKKYDYLYLN